MQKLAGQQPEGNESLREALLTLHQEYDALRQSGLHLQQLLDSLESLLDIPEDADPFAVVFQALRRAFSFSHAFILSETDSGRGLECIVAERPRLLRSHWPQGLLSAKIMAGKVVATFSGAGLAEWRNAVAAGVDIASPALYVPVRVRDRRGIMILLRDPGEVGFNRDDIGLGRRFSVVVSHALASQNAAEGRRLRELGEQLRRSEQLAHRNADLLKQLVDRMPVGVVVQGRGPDPLLINDAAERAFGPRAEALSSAEAEVRPPHGHSPVHDLLEDVARAFDDTAEQTVSIDGEDRVLLVSSSQVTILEETLKLTTSMDITDRKRSEEALHHRAYHDQLTGLPNRSLMKEIVDRTLSTRREGRPFALAFIDVDNFKQVNDYYSHALGDQLLLAISRRIRGVIGPRDTLGRISGDEFLLLVDGVDDDAGLRAVVDSVVGETRRPFLLEGHEIFSSASIGVSVYPRDGTEYETLRRAADGAMYWAKSTLKGSAAYFDDTMRHALTARMRIEQKLRSGLRDRRFRTAYQVKTDIGTGHPVGFEALVRWVDEDGTVHLPGTFIGIAGELGLIDEITRFVVEDVVADLPILKERFGKHVTMSLNVSALQANSRDFMHDLVDRIVRAGIGSETIVELTEEAIVSARFFQDEILPRLRESGIRISIDDFGTGYSSLSLLADIDADELKVDRAFITAIHERPRSQGILKAIESVCDALGIGIVAEGAESEEELRYLARHTGIRLVQGYIFGRPAFPEDLLAAGPECAYTPHGETVDPVRRTAGAA